MHHRPTLPSAARSPVSPVLAVFLVGAGTTSCAAPPADTVAVETWGTMRAALRQGDAVARVSLAGLQSHSAIAVGALADLAGEVTILDGRVLVAVAEGGECRVSDAPPEAAATLLARAEVPAWRALPLPDCSSYDALEAAIGEALDRCGFDRRQPTPVRIRARTPHIEFHVVAGACPIANPTGPPPWRFAGALEQVELVGFYVEAAAGTWTHHDRCTHLHVVAPERMGHLDAVATRDAVLLVPRR